jgi:hypothetical protein
MVTKFRQEWDRQTSMGKCLHLSVGILVVITMIAVPLKATGSPLLPISDPIFKAAYVLAVIFGWGVWVEHSRTQWHTIYLSVRVNRAIKVAQVGTFVLSVITSVFAVVMMFQ